MCQPILDRIFRALRKPAFRRLSGSSRPRRTDSAATRRTVQTLVTALTGCEPEPIPAGVATAPTTRGWGDERVFPLPGPAAPLATAQVEGAATLAAAAQKLLSLLGEIHARPPLPNGGKIVTAQP